MDTKPLAAPTIAPNQAALTRGYLICVIATVLWSSTAVFIRYLTDTYQLPSLVLAFWRDFFVFVTLAGVFVLFRPGLLKAGRGHGRFLLTYGLILSLFNSLWTLSVTLNGAAVSTVLAYSSAAFTAILGWLLFSEALNAVKVLAVAFSIAGTLLVSGALDLALWAGNPLGIITGLLSGLAFAAYSLMGKSAANRGLNPWTVLLYAFGIAAIFLLSYNLVPSLVLNTSAAEQFGASPNLFWLGASLAGWGVLFILAAGPTIGGYGLYTVSLGYLPASVANLIATLEPAMTAALAYFFLNERLTAVQLAGSVLIITGVIVLRFGEGARLRRLDQRRVEE